MTDSKKENNDSCDLDDPALQEIFDAWAEVFIDVAEKLERAEAETAAKQRKPKRKK